MMKILIVCLLVAVLFKLGNNRVDATDDFDSITPAKILFVLVGWALWLWISWQVYVFIRY
jgi:hypothetical protein